MKHWPIIRHIRWLIEFERLDYRFRRWQRFPGVVVSIPHEVDRLNLIWSGRA